MMVVWYNLEISSSIYPFFIFRYNRAGGMVPKNRIHLKVKAAHGLDVNMGPRIPKGALPAPKDPIQLVEVSAPFFKHLSPLYLFSIPFETQLGGGLSYSLVICSTTSWVNSSESGCRNLMDVPKLAYSNQDIIWDSSSDLVVMSFFIVFLFPFHYAGHLDII